MIAVSLVNFRNHDSLEHVSAKCKWIIVHGKYGGYLTSNRKIETVYVFVIKNTHKVVELAQYRFSCRGDANEQSDNICCMENFII